jgi:hypothetical protein
MVRKGARQASPLPGPYLTSSEKPFLKRQLPVILYFYFHYKLQRQELVEPGDAPQLGFGHRKVNFV